MRTGTPGFRMTGLGRTIKNPDADGDGVRNTLNDLILLYRAGVAAFGVNDTLDEFLAGECVQASAVPGHLRRLSRPRLRRSAARPCSSARTPTTTSTGASASATT